MQKLEMDVAGLLQDAKTAKVGAAVALPSSARALPPAQQAHEGTLGRPFHQLATFCRRRILLTWMPRQWSLLTSPRQRYNVLFRHWAWVSTWLAECSSCSATHLVPGRCTTHQKCSAVHVHHQ